MKLQLTRPIAFIDLETTGVTVSTDRIVEIAIVKISPDGSKVVKRKLVNPLMPIPAGASAVHGISDEMVKDAPTFKQIANEVKQFLENCDLGGYNSNRFDIPMLIEEFLRSGIEFSIEGTKLVDVQKVFHMNPQLGDTVESIVKITGEEDIVDFARRFIKLNGIEVFNFGKHKGKPVTQVLKEEPQYYDWMMKGDFAMNTKQKLTEILNRTLVTKG